MKAGLKIFRCEFDGMWPVGNCLVLAAYSLYDAQKMARETITHTDKVTVKEVIINEPKVIEYLSGNY